MVGVAHDGVRPAKAVPYWALIGFTYDGGELPTRPDRGSRWKPGKSFAAPSGTIIAFQAVEVSSSLTRRSKSSKCIGAQGRALRAVAFALIGLPPLVKSPGSFRFRGFFVSRPVI